MKYSFFREKISQSLFLGIKPEEEKFNVIFRFGDSDWTPQKAQEIIDGVENSKSSEERYEWANEDVHLVANKHGVFFFDMITRRASKDHPEQQDLELSHHEFISFMKDFKKFIEENG